MAGNNTAVVKVLADNADLTKKLAQAERKLKGFERAAQRAGKNTKGTFGNLTAGAQRAGGPLGSVSGKLGGLGSMLEGLKSPAGIAAAGIAGVALAAKGLQDALNVTRGIAKETGKLQRETGLNAEAASGYLAIADRFGISGSKLSTQLGFLSKRMKAASGDTKGAATALGQFAEAGVSEATIRSGDLNAVLVEAADKFAAMKDGPQKTALAMQLFGRSGKDLLPVLNQGGAGIEELQAKMKALGLTVGEDTVKQNRALGRATNDLSQVLKGLGNTIGVAVLPKVTRFVQAFSEAIVKFRTGKKPTNDLERAIHNLGAMFSWVGRNWNLIKTALVNSFKTMFPFLTAIVRAASAAIRTNWGGMFRSLKATAGKIWGTITGPFRSAFSTISGFVGRMQALGRRVGSALKAGVGGALRGLGGVIAGPLRGAVNLLRGIINPIVDRANGILGKTKGLAKRLGIDVPTIPRLAMGGIVTRPTIAMVGEAGPEAVVPLSPGKGARGRAVAAAAGLGGGNNYFTINTTGPVDEQALAARIGWQLATRGLA